MLALQATDVQLNEERKLFSTLIELLSYEKIIFNGNAFNFAPNQKKKFIIITNAYISPFVIRFADETIPHR